MKTKILILLCAVLALGCCFLTGCVSADQKKMNEAGSLYSEGNYESALTSYLDVPNDSDLRAEALESIYSCGVELFDAGRYENCIAYMESLTAILSSDDELYHEAYNYLYPAEVLGSYLDGYTVRDWFFDSGSLKSSAENGSIPSQKALSAGYLDPYLKLHEFDGLWRSESMASAQVLYSGHEVSKHEVYTYIYIDNLRFNSANYDSVTVAEITGSKVSDSDSDHNFEVRAIYDKENDKYRFDGHVNASISGDKRVSLSFDLRLKNETIYIDNVESSSSEYPFVSGAYTKDFAQTIQPIG